MDVLPRAPNMNYFSRLTSLFALMCKIISEYGRGPAILLWFRMFMTVLQPRLPHFLRSPQKLDLHYEGTSFCIWMIDRTGLAAFEEVFLRGEYSVDVREPHIIVDAGANIGVASVYFCLRYPNARLYTVEPNPDLLKTLNKNLKAFPHASVHQYAFTDQNGTIDLHVHPTSSIASSIYARTKGESIVSVPSRTFDAFRNEQGIGTVDLFKFDIEGAEDKMLGAIKGRNVVRCYVGEIHPDLMQTSPDDIKALFKGFEVVMKPIGLKRFILRAKRQSR